MYACMYLPANFAPEQIHSAGGGCVVVVHVYADHNRHSNAVFACSRVVRDCGTWQYCPDAVCAAVLFAVAMLCYSNDMRCNHDAAVVLAVITFATKITLYKTHSSEDAGILRTTKHSRQMPLHDHRHNHRCVWVIVDSSSRTSSAGGCTYFRVFSVCANVREMSTGRLLLCCLFSLFCVPLSLCMCDTVFQRRYRHARARTLLSVRQ